MLASTVVANHVWFPVLSSVGANAVLALYVTSGYLITRILHETYFEQTVPASIILTNSSVIYRTLYI